MSVQLAFECMFDKPCCLFEDCTLPHTTTITITLPIYYTISLGVCALSLCVLLLSLSFSLCVLLCVSSLSLCCCIFSLFLCEPLSLCVRVSLCSLSVWVCQRHSCGYTTRRPCLSNKGVCRSSENGVIINGLCSASVH